ncbi:hypothetical protein EXN66_Car020824 [Channa argus]|uniref:Uncharacterized protein n=1 Tax=Channa argus TaxID=215402 RepID=A0A6G1QS61_CHAAH|nr:hypothetical protein EXN66_Car020824 [Channa argus]
MHILLTLKRNNNQCHMVAVAPNKSKDGSKLTQATQYSQFTLIVVVHFSDPVKCHLFQHVTLISFSN